MVKQVNDDRRLRPGLPILILEIDMKRVAFKFANPAARVIVATAFLTAASFAGSSLAASGDPMAAPAAVATPVPAMAETAAHMDKESEERVAAQIKHLHTILQITPAQEGLWKDVADVMEDNAERVTALAKARSEKVKMMTAVDDLKAYAAIAEAHEKGVDKLLPAFSKLYDNLSPAQKLAADEEFRHRHGHEGHHRHGHARS